MELLPWNASAVLDPLDVNHVRLSKGFLRAQPLKWFPAFATYWLPLFHSLGIEGRLVSLHVGLEFPDGLERIVPLEIDGEPAVLGMDFKSQAAITQAVVVNASQESASLTQEYIERRLISTISMSWLGKSPLLCYYSPPDVSDSIEITGSVCMTVEVGDQPCTLWFGFGSRIVERLDALWREQFVKSRTGAEEVEFGDVVSVSVVLAELAVPPALLIDYMRAGTIIDLEVPATERVSVYVDGKLWVEGRLCQFNDRFAVEVLDLNPPEREIPEDSTRVQVEVATAELDPAAIIEHEQAGAVLLTRTRVDSPVSMRISGENIASAVVGQIDGQFALNVLPK